MSHTRAVCQHGTTISQCRCAALNKRVEVVRPCPFGAKHLGMAILHPEPPTAGGQEPVQLPAEASEGACPVSLGGQNSPGAAEGVGPRAVKACVFRTCDWTIEEPASLLGYPAMDEEIRIHLRTHRVEIELMAEAIR